MFLLPLNLNFDGMFYLLPPKKKKKKKEREKKKFEGTLEYIKILA